MIWKIYLLWIAVLSVTAFCMYGIDKRKAKRQKWRISEKTLLLTGLLGGALGALAGMKLFRHKTKHWYFWAVNLTGAALHAAAGILIFLKCRNL